MHSLEPYIKKSLVGIAAALLILFYPLSTFAVTSPSDPGPTKPTGADASTYTYNKQTGLWENEYYTWDPVTKQTTPKTPQNYSYNPSTGMWDTTQYKYNAPTQTYVPNTVSTNQAPVTTSTTKTDASPTTATTNPPASNNQANVSNTNNGTFNNFYNASISNKLNSMASTGNAGVYYNTTAGGATSGNAVVTSNLINMLQSAGFDTSGLLNFNATIQGDVVGDLLIDPSQLSGVSTASNTNNLTINNQGSGQIQNDINLNANTGNATVSGNTTAGSAVSGNADAVANLVNMINSAIGSGQSFIGNINIMGNFNGDILLPQDFLNALLASNAPKTTLNTSIINNSNVLADFTNNATINNNVNANATTGNATVANNTSAGSAATGNATSNITILNLTGNQVVGKDALLVFVNVLGQWVGMIMNAPGATSAAIGGGLTENNTTNATLSSTTDNTINNNVNIKAQSGDASVTNNTTAGDARSGNATASANIANIIGSHFSLSDWFGVLFINVFGSWTGSFGVNTAAGNAPINPSAIMSAAENPANVRVFQFVPKDGGTRYDVASVGDGSVFGATTTTPPSGTDPSNNNKHPIILASSEGSSGGPTISATHHSWSLPIAGILVAGSLLGGEQLAGRRRRSKSLLGTKPYQVL